MGSWLWLMGYAYNQALDPIARAFVAPAYPTQAHGHTRWPVPGIPQHTMRNFIGLRTLYR